MLQRIRERIAAAGGWLPFDAYMRLALYEPGLGLLQAPARRSSGRAVISPPHRRSRRCSGVASPVIAQTCWRHWMVARSSRSAPAADGLAFDILTALGAPPARYRILEVSADLRERQRGIAHAAASVARGLRRVDRCAC
ncbi:MAG: hypothetical protein WDO12_11435 [Pseudomonadota bacterium]